MEAKLKVATANPLAKLQLYEYGEDAESKFAEPWIESRIDRAKGLVQDIRPGDTDQTSLGIPMPYDN